ncbi:MAG: alpha/beta hydrolase [Cloacibacterium sp.]|uniref:alpha/beta hydrolase n=1 Tax=Cloacibacterium sp. TaxID=1913682 RepID=UPI003C75AB1D
MKLYVISGLGADGSIFEYIQFPKKFTEIIYIDWLIPNYNESFENYVNRMAEKVDVREKFCLLGYSFGGIMVQEIHKLKPAEKVVILGSIKSDKEMSITFHLAKSSRIFAKLPESYFSEKTIKSYAFFRKLFDPNNPKLWQYFKVQNPTYLKWSINKILEWKHEEDQNIIQILADKDIVFPVKNSKPNYVIKGGTHLFPVTKAKEVSKILEEVFSE